MSSRDYLKHIVDIIPSRAINPGDECWNPLTNKLTKKVLVNGNTATQIEVVTAANNSSLSGYTLDNGVIGGTTAAAGTFTPLTVYQATTASKATGLNQWVYSGKTISISAQETSSQGLFFRDDGTRMYITGTVADTVFQYNLGTAWDVSTATFTVGNSLSIAAQDSASTDIFFKPDGLAFYLLGDTNNSVFQYTVGTAWTINTGVYASKSFSVATQEATPTGLWFRPDGSTMYVVGTSSDNVNQYSLGTSWDVTTATFVRSFSVATQAANANSLVFNPTGTSFYITDTANDNVFQYNLGTAWDISTAVFVSYAFHVGTEENSATGLFIDFAADNRAYVSGSLSDAVFQYNTATTSVSFASDRFNFAGYYNLVGNSYLDGDVDITGGITVYGGNNSSISGTLTLSTTTVGATLTASSAVNFSGTTTNISLGTAQTTGTWTAGGTAQTGALTLGQSTLAQTVGIATGATVTANTKAVNIGTGGVSGSTTNITIGPSVTGSLGTTTISAPTVNIGFTNTQFQVTNTASAVNYVQVTGAATGVTPNISFQGSDGNISGSFISKGSGTLRFITNTTIEQLRVLHTGSAVNYLTVTGGATLSAPTLSVAGTDTDIQLSLAPKGLGIVLMNQQTPAAVTATATLSIANLLSQIITSTSATAVSLTLPTGTLSDAGVSNGTSAVNTSFDYSIINLGSAVGDVTLLAGTAHTIVGSPTVTINTSGRFRCRKTATNTFVSYRV